MHSPHSLTILHELDKIPEGMFCLGVKVFSMHPPYIKTESVNPKKFKLILQKLSYENSFYSVDDYFEFKKIKFIYIGAKLVFESLAYKIGIQ